MGAALGVSSATANSNQFAQQQITQQFSGNCDISCVQVQKKESLVLMNSKVKGDINFTQQCTVNGNCAFSSVMDSSADTLFKANNSANAKETMQKLAAMSTAFNTSTVNSNETIMQGINQTVDQTCHIGSYQEMKDLSILAVGSDITGNINFGQTANVSGGCQMNNQMSAALSASGITCNSAQSGKDKKKKGNPCTSPSLNFTSLFIVVAVVVVVFILSKVISGQSESSELSDQEMQVAQAKAAAGCPGGGKPAKGKDGNYLIDPKTKGPICPPVEQKQVSPVQIVTQTIGGIREMADAYAPHASRRLKQIAGGQ